MNGKDIENINKPENNDNTQNVINEQEEDNNRNENKIDFPKNAKKKDLQDLLINSNK